MRNKRWMLVAALSLSATSLLSVGCGSSGSTTATGSTTPGSGSFYGPPSWAVDAQALGSSGEEHRNLVFANADGARYVVHTGPQAIYPIASTPDRSATGHLPDGTAVTLACGGSSMGAAANGTSTPVQISGPLTVSWSTGNAVVSVLASQDTGPCSPTMTSASSLIEVIGALTTLDAAQWDQLVRNQPLPLGDGSGATVETWSGSATASTGA